MNVRTLLSSRRGNFYICQVRAHRFHLNYTLLHRRHLSVYGAFLLENNLDEGELATWFACLETVLYEEIRSMVSGRNSNIKIAASDVLLSGLRFFKVESRLMTQAPEENNTSTVYEQILLHLKQAQMAADQIGDKAAVALIEISQRLCMIRGVIRGDLMPQAELSTQAQKPLASLSVHLFGTFQAFLNGTPIKGLRKKNEAVFKYLIVQRKIPMHREKLFELFWPDTDLQSARNCLNVTIHALRQHLQKGGISNVTDSLILFENNRYYFHPNLHVWTDIDAFTNYITLFQLAIKLGNFVDALAYCEIAVALYRGHFLENDYYEEWTTRYRERLKSAYVTLLFQQSQLHLQRSNYSAALEYIQKILENDDCNEEAHCLAMRCYSMLGRRGLALQQYQVLCNNLSRELDVQPMNETTRLYEQIKNGSFSRHSN